MKRLEPSTQFDPQFRAKVKGIVMDHTSWRFRRLCHDNYRGYFYYIVSGTIILIIHYIRSI